MAEGIKKWKYRFFGPSILFLWFVLNLIFLTDYPALHSDESWLSGLSMEMMEKGRPDVTEPFFDLYPRHPHALKLVYHLLQIPFLGMGGYRLFPSRLLSLICACISLPLFRGLLQDLERRSGTAPLTSALPVTILMALDIQFISAAHTGRQEMMLLLVQILILRICLRIKGGRDALVTGLAAGLAAGIHPNAFILAWTPGLLLLTDTLSRRRRPAEGALFLAGGVLGAGFFGALSFLFNPNFLSDYLAYGAPLGVTRGFDEKVLQLPRFFSQIFGRIAGTYSLPDIRLQMMLYPLILLLPLFSVLTAPARRSLTTTEDRIILAGSLGTLAGIVLIGKYSQPSIVFFLPFLYLGLHRLLSLCPPRPGRIAAALLGLALLLFSIQNIRQELFPLDERESYREFRVSLAEAVGEEGRILGGLQTAYAFDHGRLLDYRNLAMLRDSGMTVGEYIRDRGIRYIIYPGELDFIYRSRPVWNALYGNPSHWYPGLMDFLESHCEMTAELTSPSYGTRIQAYRYRREWSIRIYRVLSPSERAE